MFAKWAKLVAGWVADSVVADWAALEEALGAAAKREAADWAKMAAVAVAGSAVAVARAEADCIHLAVLEGEAEKAEAGCTRLVAQGGEVAAEALVVVG